MQKYYYINPFNNNKKNTFFFWKWSNFNSFRINTYDDSNTYDVAFIHIHCCRCCYITHITFIFLLYDPTLQRAICDIFKQVISRKQIDISVHIRQLFLHVRRHSIQNRGRYAIHCYFAISDIFRDGVHAFKVRHKECSYDMSNSFQNFIICIIFVIGNSFLSSVN